MLKPLLTTVVGVELTGKQPQKLPTNCRHRTLQNTVFIYSNRETPERDKTFVNIEPCRVFVASLVLTLYGLRPRESVLQKKHTPPSASLKFHRNESREDLPEIVFRRMVVQASDQLLTVFRARPQLNVIPNPPMALTSVTRSRGCSTTCVWPAVLLR